MRGGTVNTRWHPQCWLVDVDSVRGDSMPASLRSERSLRAGCEHAVGLGRGQCTYIRRQPEVIGRQLLRSATSVGTNYRAACRARSSADFVSKMGIVAEEADESMYWMELLVEERRYDRRRSRSPAARS